VRKQKIRKTEYVKISRRALARIQWEGITEGQGMYMGDDGPMVKCCPACQGIYPKDPHRGDFWEKYWGHSKRCWIRKALNA